MEVQADGSKQSQASSGSEIHRAPAGKNDQAIGIQEFQNELYDSQDESARGYRNGSRLGSQNDAHNETKETIRFPAGNPRPAK